MSRLIVKNLPNGVTGERLRSMFGEKGAITDCSLKYTRSGHFRNFAFIGFRSEIEAQAALDHFNQSYLDTRKLQVEFARDFGDVNKPRAWSKYSKESSANQRLEREKNKLEGADRKAKKEEKKKRKEQHVTELLGELKDDAGFQEFLQAHQNVGTKPVWTNDSVTIKTSGDNKKLKEDDSMEEDSDESVSNEDGDETEGKKADSGNAMEKQNADVQPSGMSDLEYLKSKVGNKAYLSDSSSSDDNEDEDNNGDETMKKKSLKKGEIKEREKEKQIAKEEDSSVVYMVKMKGLPPNAAEKSIKEFFHPLNIAKIRIPTNAKKKPLGTAFVGFLSEKDLKLAMGRNKNFVGTKRILLNKAGMEDYEEETRREDKPRPWEQQKQDDGAEEGIAETGRLFVRNLPYTCTEDDLEEKFKKFGPLTEVSLPVDSFTKKIKGFAHITYMIPEHAVQAFSEMDGTIFQGRMLHILPGKEKKETDEEMTEGSSYKNMKQAKQKALAGSSHNWNTLFLGANAVADVLAEKYQAKKSKILDTDTRGSLGVRMALGETQVVMETRKFLVDSGVSLDSFSQANAARSKTVILVKNLPAGTTAEELQEMFSKYGTLGRVLLPPSGVTAIVEYLTPTEARAGFIRLAYTKFKNLPLYLEWAPMEVFKEAPVVEDKTSIDTKSDNDKESMKEDDKKPEQAKETDMEDEETPVGSTLFVKNLNFDTTDESLKQVFNKCSKVKQAVIGRKKDIKNPGRSLSLGYGFVEFVSTEGAMKALKQLQHTMLDGHQLELKVSNRTTLQPKTIGRKKQKTVEQTTTKILVRNIPFEAKQCEVEELFKVFGELKSVRLPKKMSGTGSHRGFGFVDFLTKQDAKKAFEALCHSTHLFGRRLVLEWAESADDIDEIRKRTAERYYEGEKGKKLKKADLNDYLDMNVTD